MKKKLNKASILVLDDDIDQQKILQAMLDCAGYEVTTLSSPSEALQILKNTEFDLIITDLLMPEMDGFAFIDNIKKFLPQQIIIVITAYGSIPSAVEAMKKGAFYYLTKPVNNDELLIVVERAMERANLILENKQLSSQLKQQYSIENMIGKHGRIQEVFRMIQKVAPSDTTVLIYGESGSGKELAARAIHTLSNRNSLPMQTINCAAIPEALLESELFGYEKGAFTGAYMRKKGLLEQAHNSTLFLDEIGDLSPALQSKLLRVLQEREIQRLGGNGTISVDVRIISATHHDLHKMITEGNFREDLYYRLNTFPISIPPLRERSTDIPLLIDHFLKKYQGLGNKKLKLVSPSALNLLLSYQWPGNVRQLESAIERAVILTDNEIIDENNLPPEIISTASVNNFYQEINLPESGLDLEEFEKQLLVKAMEKSNGVIAKAAPLLGITYRTLQYRLNKYNLLTQTRTPKK